MRDGIIIDGLDEGFWQSGWLDAPTTRDFLESIPFRPALSVATVGVEAAPAALLAAAKQALEVTAYELTPAAIVRLNQSARRNGLANVTAVREELWQHNQRYDMIIARGVLTPADLRLMARHLTPGGRLYALTLVPGEAVAAEFRRWLAAQPEAFDLLLLTHEPTLTLGWEWAEVIVERPAAPRAVFTAQHPRAGRSVADVEWLLGWERLAAAPNADLMLLNAHPKARFVDGSDQRMRHFLLQCDGVKSTYEHFHDLKRLRLIGEEAAPSEFALWLKDLVAEGYLEISAYPRAA